jgi:hypothetical protein
VAAAMMIVAAIGAITIWFGMKSIFSLLDVIVEGVGTRR